MQPVVGAFVSIAFVSCGHISSFKKRVSYGRSDLRFAISLLPQLVSFLEVFPCCFPYFLPMCKQAIYVSDAFKSHHQTHLMIIVLMTLLS